MAVRFVAVASVAMLAIGSRSAAQTAGAPSPVSVSVDSFVAWMSRLSNAGRWGTADQLGTLNLITPAKRRTAARSVREGLTVSLASDLVAGPDSNAILPMRLNLAVLDFDSSTFAAIDSMTLLAHGYAYSHLDALAHFGFRERMYNGFGRRDLSSEGARKLGVESMSGGIVTRGVLVDVPRLRGVPYLSDGDAVTPADLDRWEQRSGVRIATGDVVLIRTGRGARAAATGSWRVMERAAGPHPTVAAWLRARGVAALGSDVANEVAPSVVPGVPDPMHLLAIVAMGMPLMDDLDLEPVAKAAAARSRPTFLFVAGPLRIRGGTGSPLNPLAIF